MHKLILLAALVILAQAQIKNTIDFTEANEKAVTNSLKSYVGNRAKKICDSIRFESLFLRLLQASL